MYDTRNCQKELKFETDIGIEVSQKYIQINKKWFFLSIYYFLFSEP